METKAVENIKRQLFHWCEDPCIFFIINLLSSVLIYLFDSLSSTTDVMLRPQSQRTKTRTAYRSLSVKFTIKTPYKFRFSQLSLQRENSNTTSESIYEHFSDTNVVILQEVTRAHKGWALDCVVLHNDVTRFFKDDITQPPAEGVYVHGLYLDGAGWDRRGCKLVEPTQKVLFTSMPVIHIYAINTTAGRDARMYQCPIYKKPKRTDLTYIASVDLKTNQNPDHWILRGVALLCDIK